jgi:hypothetical protein
MHKKKRLHSCRSLLSFTKEQSPALVESKDESWALFLNYLAAPASFAPGTSRSFPVSTS